MTRPLHRGWTTNCWVAPRCRPSQGCQRPPRRDGRTDRRTAAESCWLRRNRLSETQCRGTVASRRLSPSHCFRQRDAVPPSSPRASQLSSTVEADQRRRNKTAAKGAGARVTCWVLAWMVLTSPTYDLPPFFPFGHRTSLAIPSHSQLRLHLKRPMHRRD